MSKEKEKRPYVIGKIILPIEIGVPATLLLGHMRHKTDPVTSIERVSPKSVIFRTQTAQYSAVPVDLSDTNVERETYRSLHTNCARRPQNFSAALSD